MRKLNISKFVKELAETKVYLLNDKGKGFNYVYDNIYAPFMNNDCICLNNIDFAAFSLEDIVNLVNEYDKNFYKRIQFNETLIKRFKEYKATPTKINFV